MTDTVLLEDTTATRDLTDLDLDIQIAETDIEQGGARFGSAAGGYTSPSTYGVQSRCPLCC